MNISEQNQNSNSMSADQNQTLHNSMLTDSVCSKSSAVEISKSLEMATSINLSGELRLDDYVMTVPLSEESRKKIVMAMPVEELRKVLEEADAKPIRKSSEKFADEEQTRKAEAQIRERVAMKIINLLGFLLAAKVLLLAVGVFKPELDLSRINDVGTSIITLGSAVTGFYFGRKEK